MSLAVTTQKTRIFHDDGAGGWTFVPGAMVIPFPESSASEIDKTCLESDGMEYLKGLADLGTLGIEINYVATNTVHQGLIVLDQSGDTKSWKIEFPESEDTTVATVATSTFSAYVNGLSGSHGVNDKQTRTMNLRASGAYAVAYGQTRETIV